jgi:hypothetical protein
MRGNRCQHSRRHRLQVRSLKIGGSKGDQATVAIGEPVAVGDVRWTVTNARQSDQLSQTGVSSKLAKTEQGNFVIVDFDFTNNGRSRSHWTITLWP